MSITSKDLLQRAKAGEFTAFHELVLQLQPRLFGLAFRILQQSQDAEDVVQQTFLTLIEHIRDFREESSLETWVLRIGTNHALKILRKRRGLNVISIHPNDDHDDYAHVPHPELIAPWTMTADQIVELSEAREQIDQALGELDEKYRTVFVLRDVEGMSTKETAEVTGITESAVKVRLLRARLALRERLTRQFGDLSAAIPHDHSHN